MRKGPARLSIHNLEGLVAEEDVDTVLVVFTDMQGRLQGKRFDAHHFLHEVVENATEACAYLLAVDVDMNTVPGYEMSSWDTGYGDFVMQPDLKTMRMMPWHPKTAVCQADLLWEDGAPVAAAPRQILQGQAARLAEQGWTGLVATELEFMVFENSFEDAWDRGYRGLTPANRYNVDYSILGTSRLEPLLGRIRREMSNAGMWVESVKGECNFGQHEIAFRYDELVPKADEHALFKLGAKEIAAQEGCAITFMAKYDQKEGNSCHIHLSLRDADGVPVFAGKGRHGMSELFEQFLAGMLACTGDFTLLLAPNINSYKRFAEGSFAPTAVAWGRDNRTCSFRIVGHGDGIRARVPCGRRRRQSLSRHLCPGRRRSLRRRTRARARTRVRRQRLRFGRAAPSTHDAGSCRPLRGEPGRPRGLRRSRGRALRQHGGGRDAQLRLERDRLGALPSLRTDVRIFT